MAPEEGGAWREGEGWGCKPALRLGVGFGPSQRTHRRWGSVLPCSMRELTSREPPSSSQSGIQPRAINLLLSHLFSSQDPYEVDPPCLRILSDSSHTAPTLNKPKGLSIFSPIEHPNCPCPFLDSPCLHFASRVTH